ncbi:MAG: type II toxin-antitoxin system VapC family toxin [Chloroflexi bacterium]|nr:type II toxin-antitoxin system VapC family toxin [Chloroflexota bacterium]
MPETIVVDASVVLKWQLSDEECITQAVALRDDFYARESVKAIAPQLLTYEVANGIVTAVRHKRVAPDKATEAMSNLMALGVELREIEPLRLLEIALRYNLATYDSAYLALAETEECTLWTGDSVFYKAMKGKSDLVKWIGEYPGKTTD